MTIKRVNDPTHQKKYTKREKTAYIIGKITGAVIGKLPEKNYSRVFYGRTDISPDKGKGFYDKQTKEGFKVIRTMGKEPKGPYAFAGSA